MKSKDGQNIEFQDINTSHGIQSAINKYISIIYSEMSWNSQWNQSEFPTALNYWVITSKQLELFQKLWKFFNYRLLKDDPVENTINTTYICISSGNSFQFHMLKKRHRWASHSNVWFKFKS